jgi:molecular chaperone GrpE (heat shock protein)
MKRKAKAAILREAAARVDFNTERYYNISFRLGNEGLPGEAATAAPDYSLYEYQTELNRIRIELFRVQRGVSGLRMPAIEAVGLDRVGEDLERLRGDLARLLGKVDKVASLEPSRAAVEGFLEVADACERVLAAARKTEGIPESVFAGMESIYRLLLGKLARLGVTQITEYERFDPRVHMALATVEDPGKPDGSIAEVQLTGYRLDDQVLRSAQVLIVRNRKTGGNAGAG